MNDKKEALVQTIETMLQRTAIGMVMLAFAYGLSAVELWVGPEAPNVLQTIQTILSILIVLTILPALYKTIISVKKCKGEHPLSDGYLSETFKHASAQAFSFTFIFIIVIEMTIKNLAMEIPTLFYIHIIEAFTLGVFSISFFVKLRKDSRDDFGDNFDSEEEA